MDRVAFNLQLLLLKSRDRWSDTSFNDLLRMLADTYPEGNKVPTNTYRTKMLIQPVAMKLEKFHACTNTVSYIGASMRTCRAVHTEARVVQVLDEAQEPAADGDGRVCLPPLHQLLGLTVGRLAVDDGDRTVHLPLETAASGRVEHADLGLAPVLAVLVIRNLELGHQDGRTSPAPRRRMPVSFFHR